MSALRSLAQRRLTEAQLWSRLERKGFQDDEIADAVARCKRDGYLDDKLYAELYVTGTRKAVGDARMVAALTAKGIDREVAFVSVQRGPLDERTRCNAALETLQRRRPEISYPSAARSLERLGFPASLIYAILRERIGSGGM
ncbi:MAG TPA: regulatory protein RecX [Candidatus Baltobacteraceae bacterium]